MTCSELQELAALKALGALEPEDDARLDALLARDADARAEVAGMNNVAATLAQAIPASRQPSPDLRAKLLRRIEQISQTAHPTAGDSPVPGFRFLKSNEGAWQVTPVPGLRVKPLSVSRDMGYWMVLAELAPGARFPEHDHHGSEQLFVLSGHLHSEGRVLGSGDFLHAEPGTHHGELLSPEGCTALLVERAPEEALR